MKIIKDKSSIILCAGLVLSLALLLYPSVSNWWNSSHMTRAIESYTTEVQGLSNADETAMLESAQEYNSQLVTSPLPYELSDWQKERYDEQLAVESSGMMGFLSIPKINVELPIYHGTSEPVLQVAVGHLEWTSLPVGGEGTHCVLSGHRGLPSADLFSHLDKLSEGDTFSLSVLGQVLTYEVDQILIVEPEDVSALQIEEGQDLCTLVTCTPYGINTHRLLVRGHRIATPDDASSVAANASQIDPLIVAVALGAPVALVVLFAPRPRTVSAWFRRGSVRCYHEPEEDDDLLPAARLGGHCG